MASTKSKTFSAIARGGVNVFLVGFGLQNPAPLQTLQKKLGCEFTNTNNAQQLVSAIGDAIQPRQYSVTSPFERLSLASDLGQPVEGLKPGSYELRFGNFTPLAFDIDGGEQLSLKLDYETRGFRRVPLVPRQRVNGSNAGAPAPGDPTFLANTAPFDVNSERLRLKLLLSHEDTLRCVGRPAEVLFEIIPDGSSVKPAKFRQSVVAGSPEPLWEFELTGWPELRAARVSAWWKMVPTPPDDRVTLSEALKAYDLATSRPLPLKDAAIRLIARAPASNRLQISLFPEDAAAPQKDRDVIEGIHVELGTEDLKHEFHPLSIPITSDFSDVFGDRIFEFTIPPNQDPSRLWVGITTGASRKRDAIYTGQPLVISR